MAGKIGIRIACLALVGLGLGCATGRIHHDFDPEVDFASLQTFHVLPAAEESTGDPLFANPFARKRVRGELTRALARRGYRESGAESADFLVGFHLLVDRRLQVRSVDGGFGFRGFRQRGFGGFRRGVDVTTSVTEFHEGTLIVDVATRADRKLRWRGWGSARLGRDADPERVGARVRKIVPRILDRFPPVAPMLAGREEGPLADG